MPSLVGAVEFEVWRDRGRHSRTLLGDIGGPEKFTLANAMFTPAFEDLNGDGRPDFSLCERTGAYVSDCLVLTLRDDGSVKALPVDNPGPGITLTNRFKIEELESSSLLLVRSADGFCYPIHWPKEGKHCLRWNLPAMTRFEAVTRGKGSEAAAAQPAAAADALARAAELKAD